MANGFGGFGPIGLKPLQQQEDPDQKKARFEGIASRSGVPVNVLFALDEAGLSDAEEAAARISAATASGKRIEDVLGPDLTNRAYDIADQLYPQPAPEAPKTDANALRDVSAALGASTTRAAGSTIRGLGEAAAGAADAANALIANPIIEAVTGRKSALPKTDNPLAGAADAIGGDNGVAGFLDQFVSDDVKRDKADLIDPKADLFDPTTWRLGPRPTVRGAVFSTLDVFGSMAPVVLVGALTKDPRAAAAVGGATSAGDAAQSAEQVIDQMAATILPDGQSQLAAESSVYQRLVAEGMPEEEALRVTRRRAAQQAAALAAVPGALGGAATERIMHGVNGAVRRLPWAGRVASTAAISGIEEGTQEVAENVAGRTGINTGAGLNLPVTEGTLNEAVLGALGGSPVGAVAGAFSRGDNQGERPPAPPEAPQPPRLALPAPSNGGTIFGAGPVLDASQIDGGQGLPPSAVQGVQQPAQFRPNPAANGSGGGVDPSAGGVIPSPLPAEGDPAGPLSQIAAMAPPPSVPDPEMFPDQKPGKEVELLDPETGEIHSAVFLREDGQGVVVRIAGGEITLTPQEFDQARVAANNVAEAPSAPKGSPSPVLPVVPPEAVPAEPEKLAAKASSKVTPPAPKPPMTPEEALGALQRLEQNVAKSGAGWTKRLLKKRDDLRGLAGPLVGKESEDTANDQVGADDGPFPDVRVRGSAAAGDNQPVDQGRGERDQGGPLQGQQDSAGTVAGGREGGVDAAAQPQRDAALTSDRPRPAPITTPPNERLQPDMLGGAVQTEEDMAGRERRRREWGAFLGIAENGKSSDDRMLEGREVRIRPGKFIIMARTDGQRSNDDRVIDTHGMSRDTIAAAARGALSELDRISPLPPMPKAPEPSSAPVQRQEPTSRGDGEAIFAANRAALGKFSAGMRVEFDAVGPFKKADGTTVERETRRGSVMSIDRKSGQGTVSVLVDGGVGGKGYDVTIGAARLRPEATQPPAPEPAGKVEPYVGATVEDIRAKAAVLRGIPKDAVLEVPNVTLKWDEAEAGFIFSRKHKDKVLEAAYVWEDMNKKAGQPSMEVSTPTRAEVTAAAKVADRNPTDAQKEAGNYQMGHIRWNGLEITIETAKGAMRRGKDRDGEEWSVKMPAHYGYIKKTKGADGDHLDIYMGPNPESPAVFIVDQVDAESGRFDEHKVMLGFVAREDAQAAYYNGFSDGRGEDRMGAINEMPVEQFKAFVQNSSWLLPISLHGQRGKDEPQSWHAGFADRFQKKPREVPDYFTQRKTSNGYQAYLRGWDAANKEPMAPEIPGSTGTPGVLQITKPRTGQTTTVDTRPSQPAPKPKSEWTQIGYSGRSFPLYEDARGVRSYVEGGVRITEPVGFVPGGEITIDKARRGREFSTTEEIAAASPPKPATAGEERGATTAPAPGADVAYGASNKLVSADRAAELRARLMDKLKNQLNAGIDPEILALGAELAVFHIEAGARRFVAMAKAIASDLGTTPAKIRPYLRGWYNGARDMMEDAGQSIEGMDDYRAVKAALADMDAEAGSPAPISPAPENSAMISPDANEVAANGNQQGDGARTGEMGESREPEAGRGRRPGPGPAAGEVGDRDLAGGTPGPDGSDARVGGADAAGARADQPDAGGRDPEPQGGPPAERRKAGSGEGLADVRPDRRRPDGSGRVNYHIADPEALFAGGPKARFAKNRAAMETYQRITDEDREPTPAELDEMAAFTGWGSFGQELFQGSWAHPRPKDGWTAEDRWLRDHLGKEGWESAQTSIINAHYTDPPTVQAIWSAIEAMGFRGGRVLEPAMGIGNFFGMMPRYLEENSQLFGIELEKTTGSIAKMLYPRAGIRIMGFEKSRTPDGFYDLVIGNWPFANVKIADRRYDHISPSLHDYFFVKAMDQVRPGGLVVGITSAFSMDGQKNKGVRQHLARNAELIAAFRLPSGAFEKYAGTRVVTDLIVLRKREAPVAAVSDQAWVQSVPYQTPAGDTINVNQYFIDNPSHVLGTLDSGSGTTYGQKGMIVRRPDDIAERLAGLAERVPKDAYKPVRRGSEPRFTANTTTERRFSITIGKDGALYHVLGDQMAPLVDVAKIRATKTESVDARISQIKALVELRKTAESVLLADQAAAEDADRKRADLKAKYLAFVKAHGRILDSYGLAVMRQMRDPNAGLVAALETAAGAPSPMMERPTVRAARKPDNPSIRDAFVMSRNESVTLDLVRIAELARKTVDEVTADLLASKAIYRTPGGGFQSSDAYLSGNVRQKLRDALEAQQEGEDLEASIAALREVQPPDVPYFQIEARFGADWIKPEINRQFISETLGLNAASEKDIVLTRGVTGWSVEISDRIAHMPGLSDITGAPPPGKRGSGLSLRRFLEATMNTQTITVTYEDEEGTHKDTKATEQANQRASDLRQKFGAWVWADPERRVDVERDYNEVMNAVATPRVDGSFLEFPGMALARGDQPFNLRQHQANAIWKGLLNQRGIYGHEVGTGKTITMTGIAVESRRYGLARKPLLIAHNANSAAVAAEAQETYPGAKILYVNNLAPAEIDAQMARMATEDWDLIVIPHSLLDRMALTYDTLMDMAADDIAAYEREAIEAAEAEGHKLRVEDMDNAETMKKMRLGVTAKEMVKARQRLLQAIEKQAQRASREGAVSFERLGVDMILVDESHEFKKPPLATRMQVKGLNTGTSNKSLALRFLTSYVKNQRGGTGVHVFSGTLITNTLAEIYHQMFYVMSDVMAQNRVDTWDGFFKTFADTISDVELTSTPEFENVERLAAFINVSELRRMAGQFLDIVFASDMPEFTPRATASGKTISDPTLTPEERDFLENGRTENPVGRPYKQVINDIGPMGDDQRRILQEVIAHAKAFKDADGKTRRAIMMGGGPDAPIVYNNVPNRASMDARLQEPDAEDHPLSKANRAVRNLARIYLDEPLATQVLFMDEGYSDEAVSVKTDADGNKTTTKKRKFNLAKDVVEKLVAAGVRRDEIAIVAGGVTAERKKAIADAMNERKIRIVIGQTGTLGVGVNMQKYLRAMHHLDAPWMPGDLEQRNGRGERQGNTWNTVKEYRYLTEGLDGRRWQVLSIKDRFIKAFLKAKEGVRNIEGDAADDAETLDGSALSETLSDAAGDPRLMMVSKLNKSIERLQQRERIHTNGIADALRRIKSLTDRNTRLKEDLPLLANDAAHVTQLREAGKFLAVIDGKSYDERPAATESLAEYLATQGARLPKGQSRVLPVEIQGFGLKIAKPPYAFRAEDVTITILRKSERPVGGPTLGSVEAAIRRIPDAVADIEGSISGNLEQISRLEKAKDEPFQQAADLAKKKANLEAIQADMEANPVPAPSWLRIGAPVDTNIFVDGTERVVTGHRWTNDGWFVSTEQGDVPYTEAKDPNGMPLYEERAFKAPEIAEGSKLRDGKKDEASAEMRGRKPVVPLYVERKVTNGEPLARWAKAQGLTDVVPASKMHVTLAYSRAPVDRATVPPISDTLVLSEFGRPMVLGEALVLPIKGEAKKQLAEAWQRYRDAGASWDFDSFTPHITISYSAAGISPENIPAFSGRLDLGPEQAKPLSVSRPPALRGIVARLTGAELGQWSDILQLGRKAEAWYRDNLTPAGRRVTVVNEQTGWEIGFNRKGRTKIGGRKGEDLYRAVVALPEILAKGDVVESEPDLQGRPDIVAVHKIAATVEIGGKPVNVVATVRETTDGHFHYDLSRDGSEGRIESEARQGEAKLRDTAPEGPLAALNLDLDSGAGKSPAGWEAVEPEPVLTDEALRALLPGLKAELQRHGLGGKVTLRVVRNLIGLSGGQVQGMFGFSARTGAAGIQVRGGSEFGERGVLHHEIIHALRNPRLWNNDFGLFTPGEWRALVGAARDDAGIRSWVEENYPDLPPQKQAEEAVAELYRLWRSGREIAGPVRRALQHIVALFNALANALRGRGFVSAALVMERIAAGRVGGRGPEDPQGGSGIKAAPSSASEMRGGLAKARSKFGALVGSRNWKDPSSLVSNLITDAMAGSGDWSALALVPGRALFAELGKRFMSAKAYLRTKEEMDALRNDWHAKADETAQKWLTARRADPRANDDFMDLMHRTTLAGIDPSGPDTWRHALEEAATRAVSRDGPEAPPWAFDAIRQIDAHRKAYAALRERFEALPAAFQSLYSDVRQRYDTLADDFERAVLENITNATRIGMRRAERAHAKEMDRIRDEGLEGEERKDAIEEANRKLSAVKRRGGFTARARISTLRKVFESNRLKGPYFPLARFGNFFVTIRDENGKVVSFSRFEKEAAQQAFIKDRKGAGETRIEWGVISDKKALRGQVDPTFVADVENMLAESGATDEVLDAVWQRWLETLPDQSIRTSKIHRKGRVGWNTDAYRAFGSHMFHGSHQLARLKYGLLLEDHLDEAEAEARRADDPNRAGLIVNEMRRRHEFTMNPKGSAAVASLSGAAFIWYLGATPAAALANVTQTSVVGVPLMAARFRAAGVTGVTRALARAGRDFLKGKGSVETSASVSEDERAAIAEALRRGTIDKTQAHDLASVAETGIEYNAVREKWMRRIGWFFHHAERFNREVTFLAAYRLAKADGLPPAEAIDAAADMTWKIHFDYQNTSRPRVMQSDIGKILTTFRNFSVNMLWRLARDMHQALRGATKEDRAEARLQLVGITLSMMAHAGVRGTWGYGLAMLLLGILTPGADSDDIEEWLQDALVMEGDTLGVAAWNYMAGAALNGVPGQLLGVDLKDRIGMPNLWFRGPSRDMEGADLYSHYVGEVLGPVYGIGEGWFRGAYMASSGELWRGTEAMVPKVLRDLMKAGRYSAEGVQTLNGDLIVDGLNPYQVLMQASGFTPAEVAERYQINNRLKNLESQIMDERKQIHSEVYDALKAGQSIPPDVLDRVRDFNRRHPEYPITSETIRQSASGRQRAHQRNEFGVSLNPRLNDRLRSERPPAIYN